MTRNSVRERKREREKCLYIAPSLLGSRLVDKCEPKIPETRVNRRLCVNIKFAQRFKLHVSPCYN